MNLSNAMTERPDVSEVAVFHTFVSLVMSLQHQPHPEYDTYRHIRDQFHNTIDLPVLQDALRDHIPLMSQQLINRIANRLSSEMRTSATMAGHVLEDTDDASVQEGDAALYTLV